MSVQQARAAHAGVLAHMHSECFAVRWSEKDFAVMLADGNVIGLLDCDDAGRPQAFVVARFVAGEAEILTIGTLPAARRNACASRLMAGLCAKLVQNNAHKLFIEVAKGNAPARCFYEKQGFAEQGTRPRYYKNADGTYDDAIIMSRVL